MQYRHAEDEAKKRGARKLLKLNNGSSILVGIENDRLLYTKEFNIEAANTTKTNTLKVGGNLGLSLDGLNEVVGVWEVFQPRISHQELEGRVEQKDAGNTINTHATHVNTTIIGAGVNSSAEGMAPKAKSLSYTSASDISEMANEAANGLLYSNHSYGLLLGWELDENGVWQWFGNTDISSSEDNLFGFYNNESRAIDNIVYNAPYYSVVWSAGNDRNDVGDGSRPQDGPFDCIGPAGVSKNIITVGAVEAIASYVNAGSVQISTFSSWGPTDDGRIKPDIVANGVDLFSASSDSDQSYSILSGTSMSAPNTTGSLILLQQLYKNLFNQYMWASTLKSLIIHGADEAGAGIGPDYSHGWGLLNTEKSANVLLNINSGHHLIQDTLEQSEVFKYEFHSQGTNPIIATLCWTDVAGEPVSSQLNPVDLMLVHDLDLRIYDSTGFEFKPFVLDPSNPSQIAKRDDNFRDNVEKVFIQTPRQGNYTLEVKHKKDLRESRQNFSLILSTETLESTNKTYYWIGSQGDWEDPTKWSLESGGDVANEVPSHQDRVIIDNQSFTNNSDTLFLNSNIDCYSLSWFSEQKGTLNMNGNDISISSNIIFGDNSFQIEHPGIIKLEEDKDRTHVVSLPISNPDLDILLKGSGSWNFNSLKSVNSIAISDSAKVKINDSNLTVDSLVIKDSAQFQILNSVINIDYLDISSPASGFDDTGSVWRFQNSKGVAKIDEQTLDVVEIIGRLNILGDVAINNTVVSGEGIIHGNMIIDSLEILPGATLILSPEKVLSINSNFDATGGENDPISISSTIPGVKSVIESDNQRRFCFDYLNISDIDVSGSTQFVTGLSSTVINSLGWVEEDCQNLLFADFTTDFECFNTSVDFIDQSTGQPERWEWNFEGAETNQVFSRNATNTFPVPGEYSITLSVFSGSDNSTITKKIDIEDFTIAKPYINLTTSGLFSSVGGTQFKWFKDGVVIEDEISRLLPNTSPGVYQVEISDGI
ncbi:MAG: S8 family serine peptidase, partial [Bacteroidota bacterium]